MPFSNVASWIKTVAFLEAAVSAGQGRVSPLYTSFQLASSTHSSPPPPPLPPPLVSVTGGERSSASGWRDGDACRSGEATAPTEDGRGSFGSDSSTRAKDCAQCTTRVALRRRNPSDAHTALTLDRSSPHFPRRSPFHPPSPPALPPPSPPTLPPPPPKSPPSSASTSDPLPPTSPPARAAAAAAAAASVHSWSITARQSTKCMLRGSTWLYASMNLRRGSGPMTSSGGAASPPGSRGAAWYK
mmetsp:Transcript_32447/g.51946  ORF Transcript_32447/g.51946 Transcript_32447/m.51946 type:complete len:243 (-) Transcript_32447:35-763(-)